jgi:N-acetylglucosaminyl-diphospho-decaprenol L-rhamnosyltransferase
LRNRNRSGEAGECDTTILLTTASIQPQHEDDAPDLSVVIVNHNTRECLQECLHSLKPELAGLGSEIYVVDNASTDGSAEEVEREFPDIRLIANTENLGFARANNLALRRARGRQVLLLNPDTVVQPGAIRVLLDGLALRPGAVAVGPKVLRPDGRLDLACRRSFPRPSVALARLTGLSKVFKNSQWFAKYNLTYQDPDVPSEIDAGTAAAMCFRRDALAAVGYFDESFFMYGEDLDLCFRLKQRGGLIYYLPQAVVLHYKGASSIQRPRAMLREFHRAMWIFYRKHYASGWRRVLVPFVWSGIQLRYGLVLGLNALRGRQVVSP